MMAMKVAGGGGNANANAPAKSVLTTASVVKTVPGITGTYHVYSLVSIHHSVLKSCISPMT